MQRLNRRRQLCVSLGAAGEAGVSWYSRRWKCGNLQQVSRTGRALGSQTTITALHQSRAQAEKAISAAFEELEQVESLLSIYRPESQLSRLNRDGRLTSPHRHLLAVLEHAQRLSAKKTG